VRKALGYSYTWTQNFDLAYTLLEDLPDARQEMARYIEIWTYRGREDLAASARRMRAMLTGDSVPPLP
jgi:hypothetical protein